MAGDMSVDELYWFLDLFDELDLTVWLDGGWGVDALLGEQTRPHADIDIMISSSQSHQLVNPLFERGFKDVHTDDRVDENFVMGHSKHGQIDFHVIDLAEDGHGIYRPGVTDWAISADELGSTGSIGGRSVRCLSPEYMVRSHTGYRLKATDLHDLAALRQRLGVRLLDEQDLAIRNSG